MSTFQTMISLVLLILALCVIVQAVQEVLKALLGTKANVLASTVKQFMGDVLPLDDVKAALKTRGLNLTALEHFDRQDFRQLLDGIPFQDDKLKSVVVSAQYTMDRAKDNIAASYEAARAQFQKDYTVRNKLIAALLSFVVVIILNANIICLYKQITADAVVQQAIVGQASKAQVTETQPGDLGQVYERSRKQISDALEQYPILLRTSKYRDDFAHPFKAILGLLIMGALVSLGTPFWNDVLKGMTGINNTLNAAR